MQIAGQDLSIKELTVGEIRTLLASIVPDPKNPKAIDLIGITMFEDITLAELGAFTNLNQSDLDRFKPSELRQIVNEINNTNSYWIECKKRIVQIGNNIQKSQPTGQP